MLFDGIGEIIFVNLNCLTESQAFAYNTTSVYQVTNTTTYKLRHNKHIHHVFSWKMTLCQFVPPMEQTIWTTVFSLALHLFIYSF